jgi:hypothetical protein
MKVCALLGMYNIVVKATVALAYIGMIPNLNTPIRNITANYLPELGLSLPRNHRISLAQCPPGWSPGYYDDIRRTHRTLVHLQWSVPTSYLILLIIALILATAG